MREARLKAAVVAGKPLSQEAMATLVSKEVGRSVHQTTWSAYESGASEPPYDVVLAAGRVSELSPAYIAFGLESDALIDPERDRKLTEEGPDSDRARAARAVEAKKSAKRRRGA